MNSKLSDLLSPKTKPTTLVVIVAVYFTLALNGSFWQMIFDRIAPHAGGSYSLLLQISLFVFFLNVFILSLFKFPYLLKSALAVLLIGGAAGAYFMSMYGVVIDDDMLRNTMQTDLKETIGLISPTLIAYLTFLGVLPTILVMRARILWSKASRNLIGTAALSTLALTLALGSILVQFKATAPFMRVNGKEMRWRAVPFNLVLSSAYLVRDTGVFAGDTSFKQIAQNPRISPNPTSKHPNMVVLVVGETARAENFSLNGYKRETNPKLSKLDVTSFSQVSSCGTATAISLPCMFSDRGRSEHSISAAGYRENLLDIAKRAGYRVIWIDNQSGSKGVADRAEYHSWLTKRILAKRSMTLL